MRVHGSISWRQFTAASSYGNVTYVSGFVFQIEFSVLANGNFFTRVLGFVSVSVFSRISSF